MKPIMLAGIGLILLGIVGLSYNQITYTSKEKILDIGPIQATAEKEKTIPLPPLFGWTSFSLRHRPGRGGLQEIGSAIQNRH